MVICRCFASDKSTVKSFRVVCIKYFHLLYNENKAIKVFIMDNTTEDVQLFYNIFATLMSKLSYTGQDKLISKFTFSSN